jgi:hypothetical protein
MENRLPWYRIIPLILFLVSTPWFHVEADVIEAYLSQLVKKLKPDGIAFIHHSNIGIYRNEQTGDLQIPNRHWRASTVSAQSFREYCEKVGLQCISQELLNWGEVSPNLLIDCISLFALKNSKWIRPFRIIENPGFMEEAERLSILAELYSFTPSRQSQPVGGEAPATPLARDIKPVQTLASPALLDISKQISEARQLQDQLYKNPVVGQLTGLKKIFYKLNHSTFSQQFNFNLLMLNLVEKIYHHLSQDQGTQNQQVADFQRQLRQLSYKLDLLESRVQDNEHV